MVAVCGSGFGPIGGEMVVAAIQVRGQKSATKRQQKTRSGGVN